MDESQVLRAVLSGVLGGRRKRGRKAMRHLLGASGGLWTNPQVLLGVAGVAWGLIEQVSGAPPAAPSVDSSGSPVPPLPPVPVSGSAAVPSGTSDARRLIQLVISAAHADAHFGDAERAEVLRIAEEHGEAAAVEAELCRQVPLRQIVADVTDAGQRGTLYGVAFSVARADEQVSGAERIYLAQLAHLLGLDASEVARIEAASAARIDAAGDTRARR